MRNVLLLAPAALSLISSTQSDIAPWRHPEVVRILCDQVAGTAFRVGPATFISVAHVTHNPGCKIDGRPFKEVYAKGDFVVLSYGVEDRRWLKVNCDGFKKGHSYIGIGYAHALASQTEVEMTATGDTDDRLSLLSAVFTVIPGMSGGPIVDADTGDAVGTVNTYNAADGETGSVEIKATSVCARA